MSWLQIAGCAFAALLLGSAVTAQQANIEHADGRSNDQTFRSLEHFTVSFKTDGAVPDDEIAGVTLNFKADKDGHPGISLFCIKNSQYPLSVEKGKVTCGGLIIPGTASSGEYTLSALGLAQARTDHTHEFSIQPIHIRVVNTVEDSIKRFDENKLVDVTISK
jgi:hypothetical protein